MAKRSNTKKAKPRKVARSRTSKQSVDRDHGTYREATPEEYAAFRQKYAGDRQQDAQLELHRVMRIGEMTAEFEIHKPAIWRMVADNVAKLNAQDDGSAKKAMGDAASAINTLVRLEKILDEIWERGEGHPLQSLIAQLASRAAWAGIMLGSHLGRMPVMELILQADRSRAGLGAANTEKASDTEEKHRKIRERFQQEIATNKTRRSKTDIRRAIAAEFRCSLETVKRATGGRKK